MLTGVDSYFLSESVQKTIIFTKTLDWRTSMTQVVLGENEGIDSALRRFKRQVSKAGILADLRSHRHFETPLEKRKRKAIVARRNRRYR
jgi:small subunit ribosomal protein S21